MLKSKQCVLVMVCTFAASVLVANSHLLAATYAYIIGGNAYLNRQEITVSSSLTGSNLTDFPLLVQITNPANPVFSNAVNGSDIVFTAADGSTVLPREIENFTTGGTPSLNAWVRTDVSSTTDTKLYMYYNGTPVANSTSTWDSNYTLVQHLEENPAGPITDSTSYGNDGTNSGTTSIAGKIGNALNFGGSAVVNLGNDTSLFPTDLTLEAWVRPDVIDTWDGIFTNKRPSSATTGVNLQTGSAQNLSALVGSGATYTYVGATSTSAPSVDTWYHLVLTHENIDENRFYVNGVQVGGIETRGLDYGAGTLPEVQIGNFYSVGSLNFNGIIDELRLSDTARSADWILAGYRLGDDASAFLTFGLEEIFPVPEPSTLALLGLGVVGLVRRVRRRQRS